MSYKGRYKPKNPEKYKGDVNNITYRSLLERSFMVYLDSNLSVLQWSSEEVIIPYISPVDNKYHRYFTDFWMRHVNTKGETVNTLVEVKPKAQTSPPKPLTGKATVAKKRRFLKEAKTWAVNEAKWNAAMKWCEENNAKFIILTEDDIRSISGKAPYGKRNK